MRFRVQASTMLAILAVFLVLPAATVVQQVAAETDQTVNWIDLQDGVKARLLGAREDKSGGEAELQASFQLRDTPVLSDHATMIKIADQLFVRVVLVPADTKSYTRAAVLVLKSETRLGDSTAQVFDDYHYKRGPDTVWLRQAGPESWKIAQDPRAWTPPSPEEIDLGDLGKIQLDFIGEIFSSGGATKTLGIEAHSATKTTDVERKYRELKALWARIDHEKLKTLGFDAVRMENYDQPRIGEFQVRYQLYVNLRRPAGGEWPELPENAPINGALIASAQPGTGSNWADLASRGVAAAAPHRVARHPEMAAAGLARKAPSVLRLQMRAADVLKH